VTAAEPYATSALTIWVAPPEGDAPVVVLSGELDMATATVLARHLSAVVRGGTDVIVDISDVTFIDSSGLRALIDARRQSEDRGRTLTLRWPARNVSRVLAITGLDGVFAIEP